MRVTVLCLVISMVTFLEAVPTDYVLETWSKTNPLVGSCKIENRLGLTTKGDPKIETTETEEVAEEEELNGLFNSFWAVDHLPKKSPFVSIQKLPDVYIDDSDLPCPISDVMTVERSEITEEAKDLQSPEFGERPLYDASMQMMDNVGNKNLHQYPNYMPYPQYAADQYPSYDDYISDNNTQYPQEEIDCPDVPLKKEEEKIDETRTAEMETVQSSTSEETKTSTKTETEETTPEPSNDAHKLETSAAAKIDSTTSTEKSTVEIKIPVSNVTSVLTEKASTSPSHSENVMKISTTTHKIQKKKGKK